MLVGHAYSQGSAPSLCWHSVDDSKGARQILGSLGVVLACDMLVVCVLKPEGCLRPLHLNVYIWEVGW